MDETETLSKLYLELANVLPDTTRSSRELMYRNIMKNALMHLDFATPKQRNGPVYRAADELRIGLGLSPMKIGGKPSDGLS